MGLYRTICCLRAWLIIVSCLLWIIGGAIFGFSLWLRLDFWVNQYVGAAAEELQKYAIALYIFIGIGGAIIIFVIIGIFGAARPAKWALITYQIFLSSVLIFMVVGVVLGLVHREEIEKTVQNSNLLREILRTQYGINNRVTVAFNSMQAELHCCGAVDYRDYLQSSWINDPPEPREAINRKNHAPLSCCADYYRYVHAMDDSYKYCAMYKIQNNQISPDPEPNDNIHKIGCGEAVVQFFYRYIGYAVGIAMGVVLLQLLGLILCAMLLFYLSRQVPQQPDDVVYEMARCQEKSPYPTRGGPYANLYSS
ncbi:hypothetical protein ScPMuIL_016582 [Solemya velum]